MTTQEHDPRFEAALEDCCRRVQQGESLASCLSDYPAEYRETIADLVPMSERVSLLGCDPSPEFQARLERQLLAQLEEKRRVQKVGLWGHLGRLIPVAPALRAAVATLVVLLLLSLGGVGADKVSADSLPDSPLYHLKAAKEWVQLAIARDDGKVNVQSNQVAQRGQELQLAVRANKPKVVENLAGRLETTTGKMVDLALELRSRGRPQAAARALVGIRTMQQQLDRLMVQASPQTRPQLQQLRVFLEQQEGRLVGRGGA